MQRLRYLSHQLKQSTVQLLQTKQSHFSQTMTTLNAVSPLATLERGYAIISSTTNDNILRDAHQIKKGDTLQAKLHIGKIQCTVKDVDYD